MIQKINLLEKANSVSELLQYLEIGRLNNHVLNVLQAENRTLDFHVHEGSDELFFVLSTGVAGEVAQKFVNYKMRFAIIGDFSGYTSKSLQDFIYESNKGKHLFFVANEDEAIARLGG